MTATTQKVALITGSTSGIGLAIAEAFAEASYRVVINGLGEADQIETVRAKLANDHKVDVLYHPANMMAPAEIEDMITKTRAHFGRLDVVVNNAGIQFVAPIEDFPAEKWDQIIGINLSSAFHTIRHAIPGMASQKWGRIINIASAHGLVASPFKSAYVAAKHGVVGLTKAVALEHAKDGVTCNAICPGYVWIPLVEAQIEDTARTRGLDRARVIEDVLLAAQPSKRFATVEELGALAAFLAGPMAASINGAAIPVDGGWTAQ